MRVLRFNYTSCRTLSTFKQIYSVDHEARWKAIFEFEKAATFESVNKNEFLFEIWIVASFYFTHTLINFIIRSKADERNDTKRGFFFAVNTELLGNLETSEDLTIILFTSAKKNLSWTKCLFRKSYSDLNLGIFWQILNALVTRHCIRLFFYQVGSTLLYLVDRTVKTLYEKVQPRTRDPTSLL